MFTVKISVLALIPESCFSQPIFMLENVYYF